MKEVLKKEIKILLYSLSLSRYYTINNYILLWKTFLWNEWHSRYSKYNPNIFVSETKELNVIHRPIILFSRVSVLDGGKMVAARRLRRGRGRRKWRVSVRTRVCVCMCRRVKSAASSTILLSELVRHWKRGIEGSDVWSSGSWLQGPRREVARR